MATAIIQPPPNFEPGSNPAQAWEDWRSAYELYEEACDYTSQKDGPRRALLLHVLGPAARKTYKGFVFPPPTQQRPRETAEDILNKFEELYRPYKNVVYSSALFNSVVQQPTQTIDELVAQLKVLAMDCDYGDKTDRLIGDRLIVAVRDTALKERLLRESSLTLDKIISICKSAEISKIHAKSLQHPATINLETNALNAKSENSYRPHKSKRMMNAKQGNSSIKQREWNAKPTNSPTFHQRTCSRCGTTHKPRNCPAYGATCHNCGIFGHFARLCKRKSDRNSKYQVAALDDCDSSSDEAETGDFLFIGELTICTLGKNSKWWHTLLINDQEIKFKIDTGSEVNIVPYKTYNSWTAKPQLRPTKNGVLTYSGERIKILGECELKCTTPTVVLYRTFQIVAGDLKPILGAETGEELGLVKRLYPQNSMVSSLSLKAIPDNPQAIIEKFPDVFEGVGKLPGLVHITLKPNATPWISAPRNIPQALQDKVKNELHRLETIGVIQAVTKPTEWVHPLAIQFKKNGGLRLCLDPRKLNKVIRREHYKLPTQEVLFSRLSGSKIFSIFDASDAFWQLELDEASADLCTFATPWGRYKFLRMPFGLNCAPEFFQRSIDEIFKGRAQFFPYFDDILIAAKTELEHNKLVYELLTLARNSGLKLNRNKIQLGLDKIMYLGHILTGKGISPDPEKVKHVLNLEPPHNTEELARFLGLVTYLTKFVPCFSQHTSQLRSLLKQTTPWVWDKNTNDEFRKVKHLITSAPILKYFNPQEPVTISTDSSSYGLGSVLLQQQQPVAFASASLTPTQQSWAQIEKELLAVVYACERFHYYIFGAPVTVQTDHKPLLGLLTKPLEKITPRLQRLIMRLLRYDVTLQYVPGKFLNVADTLSRAPCTETFTKPEDSSEDITVCILLKVTTPKLDSIREQTKADNTLQKITKYIKNGWPNIKYIKDPDIRVFSKCQDELHIVDDFVCRGQRLVIPKEAQQDIMDKLHIAHRGIVSTKNKARQALYWPTMNSDLEKMISFCQTCQKFQNNNQREPLEDRQIPSRPWQRVALDFFHLNNTTYLLVTDYFSKYVEVQPVKTTTAKGLILALKTVFARFGLPDELISDNGPPLDSEEVKIFLQSWDIIHNPAAPYNPRSNGLAERTVQTLKRSLKKAFQDGQDLFTVLMDHRNTPSNGLASPAELLMGRKIRTLVPTLPTNLKPLYKIGKTKSQLKLLQAKQHKAGDLHTKPLSSLAIQQEVWFTLNNGWSPGKIIQVGPQKRSYKIKGQGGGIYRRNRFHIKPRVTRSANTHGKHDAFPIHGSSEDYYENLDSPGQQSPPLEMKLSAGTSQMSTRSGRPIVPPERLKDYVWKGGASR